MAITELRISGVRGVVHDTVLGPTPNNWGAAKLTFKLYIVAMILLSEGGAMVCGFLIN